MESWNRAEQPVEVRRNNWNFRLAPCIPVEAFRRLLPRLDSLLEQAETLYRWARECVRDDENVLKRKFDEI